MHGMAGNTSRAELDSASPCIVFAVLALGSKCTPAFRTSAMGAPRIQVHPLSFVLSIVPMGMTKAPLDSAAGDHMCMPGSVYFLHRGLVNIHKYDIDTICQINIYSNSRSGF